MGQRKQIEDRERLAMLLQAVGAHPWARTELLRSHSGLHQGEFEAAIRLARRYRLVTRAVIRGLGQTPARYGLTPAGAERAGLVHSAPWQQRTLLAALKLDYARALLNAWFAAPGVVWALSPYLVPAQSLRPQHPPSHTRPDFAARAYRSLRLDGLACVRPGPRAYRNVALLFDPGNLKSEWLFQTFRSVHAWRRRPEFHAAEHTYFPTFVVITLDQQRLTEVVQAWQAALHSGEWGGPLRLTTLEALGRNQWWNERRAPTSLWAEAVDSSRPSRRPAAPHVGWWGEPALDEVSANQPPSAQVAACRSQAQPTGVPRDEWKRLLTVHSSLSINARSLLDRIGQYPLIAADDLAIVMACTPSNVRAGLQELKADALVERVSPDNGHILTWLGLCLLAAQIGLPPVEYARLRSWPVRRTATGAEYAVGWLDRVRAHTTLILDFLVGLCCYGPPQLSLVRWDHVQCLFDLPERTAPAPEAVPDGLRAVVPDAAGVVSIQQSSEGCREQAFWLEVDRSSVHGQKLRDKLARYYQCGGRWDGLAGNLPRLLILVERGGEGRLRSLQRRLSEMNAQYRSTLDVRLSRADLLADQQGRLNPVKPAWRTVASSEFVSAFEA
ncbi:MAG: hypothetical protein IT317_21430 [Anaerolineales bacterium]|nr:hypothetical protein [Anaerolineales bacterium]